MARDGALVSTWGAPIPGREAKSLEVFMEFLQYWGKQAAEGKVSEPETYFTADGSGGLALVRGKTDVLSELWLSDESLKLLGRAQLIVQDLKVHLYVGGTDEEIQRGTSEFVEVAREMGYM